MREIPEEQKDLFYAIARAEKLLTFDSYFSYIKVKEIIQLLPYLRKAEKNILLSSEQITHPQEYYSDAKKYASKVAEYRKRYNNKDEDGSTFFFKMATANMEALSQIYKEVLERRDKCSSSKILYETVLTGGPKITPDAAGVKRFVDEIEVVDQHFFWGKVRVTVDLVPEIGYVDRVKRAVIEVGYPFGMLIFANPKIGDSALEWVFESSSDSTLISGLYQAIFEGSLQAQKIKNEEVKVSAS